MTPAPIRTRCLWAALLCAACNTGAKNATPTPLKASADAAAPVVKVPTAPAPSAPLALVSEADVRSLHYAWLVAQNEGDFPSYERLYTERFTGVKRTGERTHRYDRSHWLQDRERMFAKPMQVEASDTTITVSYFGAVIHFMQTFSSGNFQDRGPKELRLQKTPEGLKIASEEMLASHVAEAPSLPLAAADLQLVVHAQDTYVVLSDKATEHQAQGKPELVSKIAQQVQVRKAAREDALPEDLQHVRGTDVQLYGPSGSVCRGKLGKVWLLRRETPHFGAVSETERTSATQDPPVTVAEAFWMDAVEKTLLVASIDAVDGNCAAALWARHVTQPEPQVFTSAPLPAAWQARATHAVHALPKYQQIAKAYATKLREMFPDDAERELQAKDWEAFDGMKPTYTFWQYGGRQLVVFEAALGTCGDGPSGSLSALFAVQGEQLRALTDYEEDLAISAIVDANLDGNLELLGQAFGGFDGEANVLMQARDKPTVLLDTTPPFHDCGC